MKASDFQWYNRRERDYGNGKVEITTYGRAKIRRLGSGPKQPKKEHILSDEEQAKRTQKQLCSIRKKIKEYALTNPFKWFVTLTFDPEEIDSKNIAVTKSTLSRWCRLIRDRYGKFSYLIIPEPHKSGAIHFHGLLGDVPARFVEAKNQKTGKPIIKSGRTVYNLADWTYGFSECEEIVDPEKTAAYLSKYITKELLSQKNVFKKKRYFVSQGLSKPLVHYTMSQQQDLEGLTPNFGIIGQRENGKNVVDIGVYQMEKDSTTGQLKQKNTDFLLKARIYNDSTDI